MEATQGCPREGTLGGDAGGTHGFHCAGVGSQGAGPASHLLSIILLVWEVLLLARPANNNETYSGCVTFLTSLCPGYLISKVGSRPVEPKMGGKKSTAWVMGQLRAPGLFPTVLAKEFW